MEVNNALFPSKYEPHEIKIKYKDETIKLIPVLEEMLTFLERVIDINYSEKEMAIKNFCKKKLGKCFRNIYMIQKEKMKLIIYLI